MLNRSNESAYPDLVPGLREKTFSLSSIKYDDSHRCFTDALYQVEKFFFSISKFLRYFYQKVILILSNAFSVLLKMIICFAQLYNCFLRTGFVYLLTLTCDT